MSSEHASKIRFEDLGAPVQKLLRSLKGGLSDEEMSLLEYVSVKDMAKIFNELGTNREAEQIWKELREALLERKAKQDRKRLERDAAMQDLEAQQKLAEEEAARIAAEEEAARQQRKEERRRRKEEERLRREAEAAAEEEEARRQAEEQEAEEAARRREERRRKKAEEREAEEARLREEEEEAKRKEEKRRRKAEEKAKRLAEEQDRLNAERAQDESERHTRKSRKQKDAWDEYVKNHPLEFANADEEVEIEQEKVERNMKPPPSATAELLNRVYTPKCPSCGAKYAKPPSEWDCPICARRLQLRIKCWQPDEEAKGCGICKTSVGRFSRH
eukprot:PhM_4_TR17417/c1_g1_i4/m.29416